MIWSEITSQIQGQESIFWVAAISIAAGATLLLVSGLVLAKRGLVRTVPTAWGSSGKTGFWSRSQRKYVPQVQVTDTGYTANVSTGRIPESHAPPPAQPDLKALHHRLKRAANNLEDIHLSMQQQKDDEGISGLKVPRRDVEYVFTTGIG